MHVLLLLLTLASPVAASAIAPPSEAPTVPPVGSPAGGTVDAPREKLLGAQLSAGAPEGFGFSAVVQPLGWLRGSVGFAHNVLAPGVNVSATVLPFHAKVTPTLTLEAGKFFEADVSGRVSGTVPSGLEPAFQKFGYTYYAAQLGLELGSQRSFVFFLRGGLAWVRSDLANVSGVQEGNTIVDVSNPRVRATVPTANLGFLLYVW
jgi:hypothetical protein